MVTASSEGMRSTRLHLDAARTSPVALKHVEAVYKHDVSLPTARMYNLVTTLRERPIRCLAHS